MNKHFLEKNQICIGVHPVNLATGANTGDTVSMKNWGRCAIILIAGIGLAGEDPTITVQQSINVAPSSAKALDFTRVDYKQGADLTAVGQFTTVAQAAANTYTNATSGETRQIWVIDVKAEDLDADNGFDCIRATLADVGSTAKLGTIIYILHDPKYPEDPALSAIID